MLIFSRLILGVLFRFTGWQAEVMEVLCDDKIICLAFWLLIFNCITIIDITRMAKDGESVRVTVKSTVHI